MHRTGLGLPHSSLGKSLRNVGFAREPTGKDPRIRRALALLRESHSITIAEIASDLNLSASRFRHLFKQELNVSPMHYLKQARLEQAKNLVEGSFLRIKEIAASVGLNDVSHFVRDYKARYGQTPSEARQFPNKGATVLARIAVPANK